MTDVLENTEAEAVVNDDVGGDEVELSPIEQLALEAGWKPKTEWKGDTTEYREADDFLKHHVKRSKESSSDAKKLKDQMDRMVRTNEKLLARALDEQREELEERHRLAVEAKDHKLARNLSREIDELDEPSTGDPAAEFKSRNASWFGKDEDATAYAYGVCQREANKGKTSAEQLEIAEEAVKRKYPELFGSVERKTAPAVGAPTARSSAPKAKTFDNLPPAAKQACLAFEKKGLKRDAYVRSYYEENA